MSVHQTSPLLDDLAASTKEEQDDRSETKVTQWRDQSEIRASLSVRQLKGQYSTQRMLYTKSYANSLRGAVVHSGLPGGYSEYSIFGEAAAKNGIGAIEYLILEHSERRCIYTLQYSGGVSPVYEDYRSFLGNTKIQSWYCAKTLSSEAIDSFVQGLAR